MKLRKNNLLILIIFLLILLFVFIYKNNSQVINTSNKTKVTTSFYPLYYFATQIGGDRVQVVNITPSGAEPHDYEPTTDDLINIENSKVLVLNGAGLESWGDKVKTSLKNRNIEIVEASGNSANRKISEDGSLILDPHVWLDPVLAKEQSKKILTAFIESDPGNKDYFQKNADVLFKNLDNLNNEYKKGLSSCNQKNIVTSHAAFGYIAARYSLNQIAITGVSPDTEPSPRKIAEIADTVRKYNIKYIFFEELISQSLANTIAAETNAQTLSFDPLEGLTPYKERQGLDYMSLQSQNLANLKLALECK